VIPDPLTFRQAVLGANPADNFPYGTTFAARVEQLKAPQYAATLETLRRKAASLVGQEIPAMSYQRFIEIERTGGRNQFDFIYHDRRMQLIALSLTMLVDGTDHLQDIQNLIWAICDEYMWALPAHMAHPLENALKDHRSPDKFVDLFASETACMLAELSVLLPLEPWVMYRIRYEVERRVFAPMFNSSVPFGWESAETNWSAVCCGGVGIAAMLLETDRLRLLGMLERCSRGMQSFLRSFSAEGVCLEGINYWTYGFGFFVCFAETLRQFCGINFFEDALVRRVANFVDTASVGGGEFINFSDCMPAQTVSLGMVSKLFEHYQIAVPDLGSHALQGLPSLEIQQRRWAFSVRDLLWGQPEFIGQTSTSRTVFLPEAQWLIARQTLGETPVAFACKGGHNDEPHNHNDLGHFVLMLGGEYILTDLGAPPYTWNYFHKNRYEHLNASSRGHSVPVVSGQEQAAGLVHASRVLAQHHDDHQAFLELELQAAYPNPELKSLKRRFFWQTHPDHATLQLEDEAVFEGEGWLEETLMSLIVPSISATGITWQGKHGAVHLRLPENATVELDSIPNPARPPHNELIVQRLRIGGIGKTVRLHFEVRP
jgi:hypothetical protein